MNASLLRASFDLIAPRKDEFAEMFYQRLFAKYPSTRAFFAKTDMSRQARSLAGALALVVAGVEKEENLTPALQSLGKRHATYGVLSEHYPIVGEILLESFQDFLGPQWTPAYQEAWSEAYGVISKTMIQE